MHHTTQEAIAINLEMRTSDSQHTSCLYFYDICITTSQSDCKMPTGIDGTDDKTRKIGFLMKGNYSYQLVLTAGKKTEGNY